MSRKTGLILGGFIVLLAAAVPFVYASRGMHRGGHGLAFFGHMRALRQQLDLTDDQVAKLKTIKDDLHTQNAPYRDQIHGGLQSIAKTLLANPNDVAAAQTQLDAQDAAERAMKTNTLNAVSKALNVLTPEQRTKLGAFLAKHQAEMMALHAGHGAGRE